MFSIGALSGTIKATPGESKPKQNSQGMHWSSPGMGCGLFIQPSLIAGRFW